MFNSQISSILEYTSEVWFKNKASYELEKNHLQYLKSMMHIKPSSSTKTIYAEFGRFPLIIKQKCQLIKYWKRILTMNEISIVKKVYNSTFELYEFGHVNWCSLR